MGLDIYELDQMGFIPFIGDSEASFVERSNMALEYLEEITDEVLIILASRLEPELELSTFVYQRQRLEVIKHIIDNYGSNLSWVRCLKFKEREEGEYTVFGYCVYVRIFYRERQIHFPIVFAARQQPTVQHEFLHAARSFIRKQRGAFEEGVARSEYLLSHRFSFTREKRTFAKIRRKLKKFFGDKHGYVFIRLREDELMQYILPDNSPLGNPVHYLRRMADRYLKHRIMCEKLGLWKYDLL